MAEMFSLNRTIATLEMEGNKFDNDGINLIIENLAKNWSLTDLTISTHATNDQLDIMDDLLDRNFDKIYEENQLKKKNLKRKLKKIKILKRQKEFQLLSSQKRQKLSKQILEIF